MNNINPANERLKRTYINYLKEAARRSEPSVDSALKALSRFETYTRFKDFRAFHQSQAVGFKRHLGQLLSARTGEKLSKATLHATLADLKKFFHWLAGQPGFKSRLTYADADYFNLSDKDVTIAKARRERPVPTLEQIKFVIARMPSMTELERRDRALVAFTILTGARDGAIASLKLKHIDIGRSLLEHDAREVNTKFSKSFPTWFFPVGDDIRNIIVDWVDFLRNEKHWGLDDPLFPATSIALDAQHKFKPDRLSRAHWSSAGPIREAFRRAFAAAGLPYFNPHSFRKTLVLLAQQRCATPEEFKAWSQNLGHEQVTTTFTSYGTIQSHRQAEIMRALASAPVEPESEERLLQRLLEMSRRRRNPVEETTAATPSPHLARGG